LTGSIVIFEGANPHGQCRVLGASSEAGALDFDVLVSFDDVARLEVLEIVEADTTFEALTDLSGVVLEPAQRGNRALPDDRAVAQEADLGATRDDAGRHHASGNRTLLRDPEDLADLGFAGDLLLVLGIKHADHRQFDILEQLVDDLVGADLDLCVIGSLTSRTVRPHVEPDNRGIGRLGQRDVILSDPADRTMDKREFNLVAVELAQRAGDRLE